MLPFSLLLPPLLLTPVPSTGRCVGHSQRDIHEVAHCCCPSGSPAVPISRRCNLIRKKKNYVLSVRMLEMHQTFRTQPA